MTEHPEQQEPEAPQRASWTWLLGLVVVVGVIAVPLLLMTGGAGDAARGLKAGSMIPPFAAPLAASDIDGDVNLARRADSGEAGAVAACSVRGPGIVNSCDLVRRKPAAILFITSRDRCERQLDVLDSVLTAGGPVNALAVGVRGDRDEGRKEARRWNTPLAFDRDGVLAASFGIELCPQITVVRRGGRVAGTIIGSVDARQLRAQLRRMLGGL